MSLLQRLDPRLHLSAAIGWSVSLIVVLAALVAATIAAGEAERRARADTERLLGQFATQIRQALAMSLHTRFALVQATALQIAASSDRGDDALRSHIAAVQDQFPEFAWIGVADAHGRIVAATEGALQGGDVSLQAWFQQARGHPYLGEIDTARWLEKKTPPAADGVSQRYIVMAAPITHGPGRTVGVIFAHLSWAWIDRLQPNLLHSLGTHRQLNLLLAARDGTVLAGPDTWRDRTLGPTSDLTEAGAYVVGQGDEGNDARSLPGWTVWVRQAADEALATAKTVQQVVFGVVLLAGLVAAGAAAGMTQLFTRRLDRLAEDAQSLRRGAHRNLTVPAGSDEVYRIGASLVDLVNQLQQEKQDLATLNAELDARVAERTARIERLSDEARHAAVTRERLRLARDLHDTLAHSLMALLTQIRLVRKLRQRLAPDELDAELDRAEAVAASGLAEARAAIMQMRHSSVRDAGLGPALQELLVRFGERSGIAATLVAEPQAAGFSDERVETVFRIVEEALHNVERHAQARAVQVTLQTVLLSAAVDGGKEDGASGRLRVEIADDGVGFDPTLPRPGHFGLHGIQEQAALIEARLTVDSQPGDGTRIVIEFDA